MKIFIIGGVGFVGFYFVDCFCVVGDYVIVFDDFFMGLVLNIVYFWYLLNFWLVIDLVMNY